MLEGKAFKSDSNVKRLAVMVKRRVDEARGSDMEKAKALRVEKTMDMMFMRPGKGEYVGRYGYVAPIFWAAVRNDQAMIKTAFNNNPFVSIVPGPSSSVDENNLLMMQKTVNWNIIDTEHKEAFHGAVDDVCQHGTSILKNVFMQRPKIIPSPIPGPVGEARTELVRQEIGNDYSTKVHIQNYLQDTSVTHNDMYAPDPCNWVCEINDPSVMWFMDLKNEEGAIKENINEAIAKIKKGASDKSSTYRRETDGNSDCDYDMRGVVYDMVGRFPIKKNEDDKRFWRVVFCEITNKVLFVTQVEGHNMTIFKAIKRPDSYMGRANAESIGSNQLLSTMIKNKGVENLFANMQRYFFYLQDLFDPSEIQDLPTGSWVPTRFDKKGFQQISQVIQEQQGRDLNLDAMRVFLGLLNDERQLATGHSDQLTHGFSPSIGGGGMMPGGYTAHAASIVEQNRATPAHDMFNQIAQCCKKHWKNKILSLQINLPDYSVMRITGQPAEILRKFTIMGSYDASVESGLNSNKAFKYQTMQGVWNFMAGVLQMAQSNPAVAQQVQDMNFRQLLRDAMELNELPHRDKILPETPPQINTQAQAPQPGAVQPQQGAEVPAEALR